MNTLIKLNSFDNKGVFDVNFNDEIIIPPKSSIAFQSCSIKRNNARLVVDAFNQDFQFQVSNTAGLKTFSVSHDTYSKLTRNHLFTQMTENSNKQLSVSNPKELGTEIKFFVDDDGKFKFQPAHRSYGNASKTSQGDYIIYNGLEASNTTGGELKKTVGSADSGLLKDNYVYSKLKFVNGCGVARCRIKEFVNRGDLADPAGMGVGLTTAIDKLTSGTITFEDLDFAISTPADVGGTYDIRHPTQNHIPTFKPTAENIGYTGVNNNRNDVFGIQLTEGQIKIVVHKDGGTDSILSTDTHDFNKVYYVVYFCLAPATNNKLKDCRFNIDPFADLTDHIENLEDEPELGRPAPPRTTGRRTTYKFNFPNESTAEFFGFENPFHTSEGAVEQFQLVANNIFSNTMEADNYLVQLLNLPLNSYDSFISGRMNLLAVIPVSEKIIDDNTGLIQYEPNTPYYISINNINPLSLRNIRLRILTADHQQIITDGLNSVNVLIKTPE
jgi:hypothetical protein